MKHRTKLALLLVLLIPACASKTPPEFLQNASAGMFGGLMSLSGGAALESVAPAPRTNGFQTFYGGGDE